MYRRWRLLRTCVYSTNFHSLSNKITIADKLWLSVDCDECNRQSLLRVYSKQKLLLRCSARRIVLNPGSLGQVIDDEVCWKWSEYETVLDVFNTRASLHRRIYGHRPALPDHKLISSTLMQISFKRNIPL